MKLQFLGAQEGVTGSCYHIQSDKTSFLIDCGQFQGSSEEERKNREPFPFDPKSLDFVVLTHAHIDHTGRLPRLVKEGFTGRVFMTRGTASLSDILLKDSGKIHEVETEKENEKRLKAGLDLIEPYYDVNDVINTLQYFNPLPYEETYKITNDISVKFLNAGHLLGSAHVYLTLEGKSLLFSGDVGTYHSQILLPPRPAIQADYIFVESTYGNRLHKQMNIRFDRLADIILETIENKGTVIIPAFSVGRTQDIIYGLNQLDRPLSHIPFYVDSPMAINATKVFEKDLDGMKPEIIQKIKGKKHPFEMKNLQFIDDASTSYKLDYSKVPKVLISASGMCDAGRILHHLKTYLEKETTSIVFVGYQAEESQGRKIQNKKDIMIYGEEVKNRANVFTLHGFSGHADQEELLEWLTNVRPKKLFLVHGDFEAIEAFNKKIKERYKFDTYIPRLYETIEL
ncbi:MBL fold metallo-hydrolase RNA specificity domain-containing protein [Acidaminobacter sp. JC074]|uniref:MBL fold metallo-hydrolase RNA specificity domain-containing protein n=1 Tax=Acidaminobacter sp. JC074 TaxID=2530199 RepID=UPI001F1115C4|nr:MBL fold metallo-hydrolase [Acidaminobacter sp. JC074]